MSASRPDPRPPLVAVAASAVAKALASAARFASPRASTAGRTVGHWLATAARWVGRLTWRGRGVLVGLTVRALWWASLLVGLDAWMTVTDTSQPLDVEGMMQRFAVGLALCAAVTALASARQVRWAGIALGTAHGAAILLLHSL